jgi:prohibitin 2
LSRYLGDAIAMNPGYLKLRKIRAAQNIAKTVRTRSQIPDVHLFIEFFALKQVSASQNRIYLNSGSLMLNIADKEYDITSQTIQKKK